MGSSADIVLIGGGTGGLQLSVEGLRLIEQHGFAFTVGVSPVLTALLTAQGIDCEQLDDIVNGHDEPADALLAAADVVLKQVEVERPVLVVVPGNPMFLNSLSRFLLVEGQRRELRVERIAGTSVIDIIVNELAIDVAGRGLHMIEASSLIDGRTALSATSPTVVLGLGGTRDAASFAQLADRLADTFPSDHPVTLVNVGADGDTSHATGPLSSLGEFAEHIHSGSSFFLGPAAR